MDGALSNWNGKENTPMQNSIEEVKESAMGKDDRLVGDVSLVKIMVVKKKYLDQVPLHLYTVTRRADQRTLPESIGIVGLYYTERDIRFPYILFIYRKDGKEKVGRVELFDYAAKVLDEEQPSNLDLDYKEREVELKKVVSRVRESLPQIFVD